MHAQADEPADPVANPSWSNKPSDDSHEPRSRRWCVLSNGRGVRGHPYVWMRHFEVYPPRRCRDGHARRWTADGSRAVCDVCDKRRHRDARARGRWLEILENLFAMGRLPINVAAAALPAHAARLAFHEYDGFPVENEPTYDDLRRHRAAVWRLEDELGIVVEYIVPGGRSGGRPGRVMRLKHRPEEIRLGAR